MKTEKIVIRTTPAVKEQAKLLAEKEGRNVTNYIEWLIKQDQQRKEAA